MKLHAHNLGLAGGILAVICMVLLSIAYSLGLYEVAVESMQSWHLFYAPTVGGTITGAIEAFIWTYVCLYAFAWLYNKLGAKKK